MKGTEMFNLFCHTCGMDQFVEGTRADADLVVADHAHSTVDIEDVS